MKNKKTSMIMYLILFLIISLPFAIADSFASINQGINVVTGAVTTSTTDCNTVDACGKYTCARNCPGHTYDSQPDCVDKCKGENEVQSECWKYTLCNSSSGTTGNYSASFQAVTIENGFGLDLGFVSDSIDLPSPANICTQKSEDIEDFLDMMESDIIKTLTDISNMLYALTTVASTINTVIEALACIFPGSSESTGGICKLPIYGEGLCSVISGVAVGWAGVYKSFATLSDLLMCGKGEYQLGWWQWCSGNLLGPIDAKPFDNIYTAISCLCPTAILFNLRKLKLMYQTFNCCVKAACSKGISTTSCYKYLDQATCNYWEGSIVNMIIDLIVQEVGQWLMDKLVDYLVDYVFAESTREQIISCIKLVQGAFLLLDLETTIQWVDKQFNDPDCSVLMIDASLGNYSTGTTSVSLIDNNGLYTS